MKRKSEVTKERILLVAAELFAGHGFQGTTHQMICSQAEVNIAAINYHFGNKESLYLKVWEYLFRIGMSNYHDFVNEKDPPEEQLRAFIHWRVRNVIAVGPRSYLSQILRREMNKPSPVFEQIQILYLNEKRTWFFALISKIVGYDLDVSTITMAAFCIHSPLIHLVEVKGALKAIQEGALKEGLAQFWEDPEALAESIYTFALAGLKELSHKV